MQAFSAETDRPWVVDDYNISAAKLLTEGENPFWMTHTDKRGKTKKTTYWRPSPSKVYKYTDGMEHPGGLYKHDGTDNDFLVWWEWPPKSYQVCLFPKSQISLNAKCFPLECFMHM